mmetsp:Transcript_30634/g.52052  ORF Transcript_30634/g.52052 Transcript_30634/m.52052 type:complete len:97 (+) Transcript_30634:126-416(+)
MYYIQIMMLLRPPSFGIHPILHILACRGPIKTTSGDLESSHCALSKIVVLSRPNIYLLPINSTKSTPTIHISSPNPSTSREIHQNIQHGHHCNNKN